jgi:RNA polymerase sigma factor (sigma-70 family)
VNSDLHGHQPAPPGLVIAALRESAGPALAIVARRIGDFQDAEDALQEALAQAAPLWSRRGIPDSPQGWLVTVATRRAIDAMRSDTARRERERRVYALDPEGPETHDVDDTVSLYLLCCHPALTTPMQVALTLRAVGGLTTREIARGLLLSETTVAQRISRGKAVLRHSGARFSMPEQGDIANRVAVLLHLLGMIHTEAHSATEGDAISRPALASDALRIARELLRRTGPHAPWRGELLGLIALMLLTDARAPARVGEDGTLHSLAEQDRSKWRVQLITEGGAILAETLPCYPLGPFQLKAAIAGVHAAATSYATTDWRQVLCLYDLLRIVDPSPVVELARLVAFAEVSSPEQAIAELEILESRAPRTRVAAVRAHLLARSGRDATAAYREAAELSRNGAERRWLQAKLHTLVNRPLGHR